MLVLRLRSLLEAASAPLPIRPAPYKLNRQALFWRRFGRLSGIELPQWQRTSQQPHLRIEDGSSGGAGSAWYVKLVNIQSFTNDNTLHSSGPFAHGIFCILIRREKRLRTGRKCLRIGLRAVKQLTAIKFHPYCWAPGGLDSTSPYPNVAIPADSAANPSGTGIDLHSDDAIAVHLIYNGTILRMTLTERVTAATWSTSCIGNQPTAIGNNTQILDSTGSTEGLTPSRKIVTWSYSNSAVLSTVAPSDFAASTGPYTASRLVTVGDTTNSAKIYYITVGSAPTNAIFTARQSINIPTTLGTNTVFAASPQAPLALLLFRTF